MLGGFADGALEFRAPVRAASGRPRIDQIERVALEDRARDRDRLERFVRGVQPAKLLQRGIVSACTPSETRLTPAAR